MTNWPITHSSGVTEATNLSGASSINSIGTSWTELIAATTADYHGFFLAPCQPSAGTANVAIDIGIGASSQEYAILTDFLFPNASRTVGYTAFIPIFIPKGSRVVARCSASTPLQIFGCMQGWPGMPLFSIAEETTENQGVAGTTINTGASANTDISWVQMLGSTTRHWKAIMVEIALTSSAQTADALIDIAIGAGGSEQVLLSDLSVSTEAISDVPWPILFGPFPCDIPAGTRIAGRGRSSTTNSSGRSFEVKVHGFA